MSQIDNQICCTFISVLIECVYFCVRDNFMAASMFRVFDESNRGALTFLQFMTVKTAPKLENPAEKLTWVFNAFDEDLGLGAPRRQGGASTAARRWSCGR